MERIKKAVTTPTILIGLGGVVLGVISIFLPWFTNVLLDLSLDQTLDLAEWFQGETQVGTILRVLLIVGFVWMGVFYLLRFPKTALIGILPLALVWFIMYLAADNARGTSLGAGAYVYIAALILCIIMSFATPKMQKNPPNYPNYPTGGGNPPVPPGPRQ